MRSHRSEQVAAIAVFVVVYAALSHYANSAAKSRDLGIVLAVAPVLAVGLILTWRAIHPWIAILAAGAAAMLLRHFWPVMEQNFPVVYLVQEGGFYTLMAASFGLSLFGRRVALCTQLADKVHGPLRPEEVRYTRRVTAAWSLFFVAIAAVTVGLYLLAPLRIWSLFANFCAVPLMGLMFVAEYAVRRRVLPQVERRGILAAVRVYFASSRHAP